MKLLIAVAMFLTAISLAGCDSVPDLNPKLIDWNGKRFALYRLSDKEEFKFTFVGYVKDLPSLDGHYAFSAEEIARWNSWGRRQAKRLKECEASR